jgi:arylformamidase
LATDQATGKVWRDLDQAALDAAYDQTVFAPNHAHVIGRMVRSSNALAGRLDAPSTFSYGDTPIEKIFYFPPRVGGGPIHVHVHGGAWRQRMAAGVLFPAEMFVQAGVGFAAFDFISVDETGGDLLPMRRQVEAALAWIARNAETLGGDPDRLHLSGFSSGAHLAAVAMTADWRALGFDRNPYRSATLVSGMYDLHPVRLSKRSEYVKIDDDTELRLSPQRHIAMIDVPLLLACGTCETPEFQRQTQEFAEDLRKAGKPFELIICEGFNHYEMMEMFAHPHSSLGRGMLERATGAHPIP